MKQKAPRRIFFVLFLLFSASIFSPQARGETFYGEIQTGFIQLTDFKYPVFLYVPSQVEPGEKYTLVIALPEEGHDPSKMIETWKGTADRLSLIVLSPTYQRTDAPEAFDQWFFEVKHLVAKAYPVNAERIFLIGTNSSAAYAGYLGIRYPEEFSAVSLVGAAWDEKFSKIASLKMVPAEQIPFYVALKKGQTDTINSATAKAYDLEEKGYPVAVQQYEDKQDFTKRDFHKELLDWMQKKAADWQVARSAHPETFKQKVKSGIKDFFKV